MERAHALDARRVHLGAKSQSARSRALFLQGEPAKFAGGVDARSATKRQVYGHIAIAKRFFEAQTRRLVFFVARIRRTYPSHVSVARIRLMSPSEKTEIAQPKSEQPKA